MWDKKLGYHGWDGVRMHVKIMKMTWKYDVCQNEIQRRDIQICWTVVHVCCESAGCSFPSFFSRFWDIKLGGSWDGQSSYAWKKNDNDMKGKDDVHMGGVITWVKVSVCFLLQFAFLFSPLSPGVQIWKQNMHWTFDIINYFTPVCRSKWRTGPQKKEVTEGFWNFNPPFWPTAKNLFTLMN